MSHDAISFRLEYLEALSDDVCDARRGLGLPCPFCAEPNFTKYPVYETAAEAQIVQTCEACGRSGRYSVEPYELQGFPALRLEILQVAGPQQPVWLPSRVMWIQ